MLGSVPGGEAEGDGMTLRVLSLGAGVQSSTLLLMACNGELQIDAAIFADTGWEPQAVYKHLDWLERQAVLAEDHAIPVVRVSGGDLRAGALAGKSESWMPLYSRDPVTGKPQQLKRQCTRNYKVRPIRRECATTLRGTLLPDDSAYVYCHGEALFVAPVVEKNRRGERLIAGKTADALLDWLDAIHEYEAAARA